MMSLDSFLEGGQEPQDDLPIETPQPAAIEPTAAPQEPAQGVIAEPPSVPSQSQPQEPHEDRIPKAALLEERRKRQEMERELATYRQQFAQQQQPQFEQDPNQWAQHVQQTVQSQVRASLVDMSESLVRAQFQDFDAVRDVFIEQAQQNPAYAQQMFASANPALYAYKEGKRLMALQEMGEDPQAWKKSIEEKAVKAYLDSQKQRQVQETVGNLPTSLADVRATGGQKAETYSGPKPLDDILKSKRKK